MNADEAVRIAKLARAGGLPDVDQARSHPGSALPLARRRRDPDAAEKLVADGFTVLPYVNADPVLCKRLEEVGCATVMPLGSWIGSNQGLRTRGALEIIVDQARVPVVVDAGLGAPSHAAEAMELGAARSWSTPLSAPPDPAAMAEAFRLATIAGRQGYLAGLAPSRHMADASSPLTGFLSSAGCLSAMATVELVSRPARAARRQRGGRAR